METAMLTEKLRAIGAIALGVIIILTPNLLIYILALALIAYGVNELYPDLKHKIRDYLRGSGRAE
jgi:multisubunit Na+/H+ antiporter MnhC subunit